MEITYIPEGFKDDYNLWEPIKDGLFNVGQSYEDEPAQTIRCLTCGGKEFNVGTGNYFTAIKCVKCGWEDCIHEG